MKFLLICIFLVQSYLFSTTEIITLFDIGTGKIKMQVVELDLDGVQLKTLYCNAIPSSLQQDSMIKNGIISSEGQEKVLSVLSTLKNEAEKLSSNKFYGVATELYRKADNGQEFVEFLSNELDIEIEVIAQDKEGILGYLTVTHEADLDPENSIVWDIGSGSFQVTCKNRDQFIVYKSPYSKKEMLEMVQNGEFSQLENAFSDVPEIIKEKIAQAQNKVIGIGSHPKLMINSNNNYSRDEIKNKILSLDDNEPSKNEMILTHIVMQVLGIDTVDYYWSVAGNTTGILFYKHLIGTQN